MEFRHDRVSDSRRLPVLSAVGRKAPEQKRAATRRSLCERCAESQEDPARGSKYL